MMVRPAPPARLESPSCRGTRRVAPRLECGFRVGPRSDEVVESVMLLGGMRHKEAGDTVHTDFIPFSEAGYR